MTDISRVGLPMHTPMHPYLAPPSVAPPPHPPYVSLPAYIPNFQPLKSGVQPNTRRVTNFLKNSKTGLKNFKIWILKKFFRKNFHFFEN